MDLVYAGVVLVSLTTKTTGLARGTAPRFCSARRSRPVQLMAQSSAYAQQVRRRLQGIAKQRSAPSPNRYTPSAESVDVLLEDKELDESLLSEGIVPGADEIPSRTQVVLEELGISFYEIKSEHQPSARGATTRPATD